MRTEWILPCAGLGSGLAVLLVFAGCWLALRKRRLRIRWSAGEWMNALGFALLPALAVFKAFEPYMGIGSVGKAVFDPLPLLPWAIRDIRYASWQLLSSRKSRTAADASARSPAARPAPRRDPVCGSRYRIISLRSRWQTPLCSLRAPRGP